VSAWTFLPLLPAPLRSWDGDTQGPLPLAHAFLDHDANRVAGGCCITRFISVIPATADRFAGTPWSVFPPLLTFLGPPLGPTSTGYDPSEAGLQLTSSGWQCVPGPHLGLAWSRSCPTGLSHCQPLILLTSFITAPERVLAALAGHLQTRLFFFL